MQLLEQQIPNRKKAFLGKGLIYFFALMLVCTVVSRMADSVTVAKVNTQKAKRAQLSFEVEGSGTISATETKLIHVPGGYIVESGITAGKTVKKGDVVLTFLQKDLEKKKKNLETELQKLKLQLEQANLAATPDATVPAADAAARNLEEATQKYNECSGEYEQLYEQYQTDVQELNAWYEEESGKAFEIGDQETLSGLEAQYKEQLASLDGSLTSKSQEMTQYAKDIQLANGALEDARKNDDAASRNQQKASQGQEYTAEGLKIDVQTKDEEYKELEELIENGGCLYAAADGTVLNGAPEGGTVSSGSELITVGTGGFELKGTMTEEESKQIATGDVVKVKLPGKEEVTGSVEQVFPPEKEEDSWTFTAVLQGEKIQAGIKADFTLQKNSEEYGQVLPLAAVHQDTKGYYCLTAETRSGILGEEYRAVRVDLSVVAKDGQSAAVTGALTGSEQVIVGGNKNVEEGDRVRLAH